MPEIFLPSSEVPIIELSEPDRLWMECLYNLMKKNKRPTFRIVHAKLQEQLPKNYDAKHISRKLVTPDNLEVTVLGIVALEKDRFIVDKANKVINAIGKIIKEDEMVQAIEAVQISEKSGVPENEVHILLLLLCHYFRYCSSYGKKTKAEDYYGAEFITFDEPSFQTFVRIGDMGEEICKSIKQNEENSDEEEFPSRHSLAKQVLAIHFMLKELGVNGVDEPAAVSRFVQFLTGKEMRSKRIQDTSIYKRVKSPFRNNDQFLLKELQSIRSYFESMGLDKILNQIDHEIDHSRKSG